METDWTQAEPNADFGEILGKIFIKPNQPNQIEPKHNQRKNKKTKMLIKIFFGYFQKLNKTKKVLAENIHSLTSLLFFLFVPLRFLSTYLSNGGQTSSPASSSKHSFLKTFISRPKPPPPTL